MSELRATPGIWQAFIPIDGERWTVASHRGPLVADCGIGENTYSGANAHLIAAAPDGYALAELVMDICGNPKGISEASQDELYEAALQYTKKARGES